MMVGHHQPRLHYLIFLLFWLLTGGFVGVLRLMLCLLILLCSVGVTEEKKLVQRLNCGVVFREDSHLILSNEYWFHTYEITIPEYVAIPNIGTCHKDNSTCLLIAHVLTSINTVRSETAARLNSTVETIKKLVPKLEVHKSRS